MPQHPSAQAAQYKAANRQYELDWRSTGSQLVVGRAATAATLGVTEQSLQVYLSNGKAKRGLLRTNPQTGELDIVTVTAGPQPVAPSSVEPKPKGRRGRPRKERLEQP